MIQPLTFCDSVVWSSHVHLAFPVCLYAHFNISSNLSWSFWEARTCPDKGHIAQAGAGNILCSPSAHFLRLHYQCASVCVAALSTFKGNCVLDGHFEEHQPTWQRSVTLEHFSLLPASIIRKLTVPGHLAVRSKGDVFPLLPLYRQTSLKCLHWEVLLAWPLKDLMNHTNKRRDLVLRSVLISIFLRAVSRFSHDE